MAKTSGEDLFAETTMTFGEHLEELRTCLVRALTGLGVGMLLGLWVADSVVRWMEAPLITALEKHYSKIAEDRLQDEYGSEVTKSVVELAAEKGLTFEVVYLERSEAQWLLKHLDEAPEDIGNLALGADMLRDLPPPTADLIKTRIWRSSEAKLTTLSPHEGFLIWLKAGFVFGMIIASPYMFYQIWTFVAAGLYRHEKRYVYVFLPFSLILFLLGAALAFLFVFGPVLEFLFNFSRWMDIDPDLRISEVISFVLFLPLGFGLAFQLPLVMLFMNRIGIFTASAYLEKWRIAILVVFVLSMLLTPADPISMLLMAVPLTLLYFLGIALCVWMSRSRNPFHEAYDPT